MNDARNSKWRKKSNMAFIKINWWHLSSIWMLRSFNLWLFFVLTFFFRWLLIHSLTEYRSDIQYCRFQDGVGGTEKPSLVSKTRNHKETIWICNKLDYDIRIICPYVFVFVLFLTRAAWNYPYKPDPDTQFKGLSPSKQTYRSTVKAANYKFDKRGKMWVHIGS